MKDHMATWVDLAGVNILSFSAFILVFAALVFFALDLICPFVLL